jgi:hypothetical protein
MSLIFIHYRSYYYFVDFKLDPTVRSYITILPYEIVIDILFLKVIHHITSISG